jgi:serine/threonine protein kinase
MHQRGVIHRDIKPENLMLSRNGVVKICDLGSARLFTSHTPMSEYVSTRWYRAPELLVNHQNYGAEIDVWAIGCIFVELLTGKALFNGNNELDMLRLILKMFEALKVLYKQLRLTQLAL